MMQQECLKCGHVHEFAQTLAANACPNCGAIYLKVEQAIKVAEQVHTRTIESGQTASPGLRPLHWLALACGVTLAISTAVLGSLYYQEMRLNRVLLSQREITPEVRIANPAPAIVAAPSTRSSKASPQIAARPPADLAENAEVIVVSGYEAANQASQGTVVRVAIDRPGKSVVLVLTSYEKIAWKVAASEGTLIKGILVSGYEPSSVHANGASPVFKSDLPYSYEKNSGNFAGLLKGLNLLFGITRVDAFRGEYALANDITIDQLDPRQTDLSLQGEQPQAPLKPLQFELTTHDYGRALWSLEGPSSQASQLPLAPRKTIKASQDQLIYQITGHDFQVTNPANGKRTLLQMPDNFPSLSWPMDVAYDSKRHYVTLASLGGEGFLYRFDTNSGEWLDFRSLENVDISSLAYDELADRYVAWTSDGGLFFAAGDGTPLYTKRLADRLPGFNRLYDTGNSQAPDLLVVPRGDQIALIKRSGQLVEQIWYYDVPLDIAQLTYKQHPG